MPPCDSPGTSLSVPLLAQGRECVPSRAWVRSVPCIVLEAAPGGPASVQDGGAPSMERDFSPAWGLLAGHISRAWVPTPRVECGSQMPVPQPVQQRGLGACRARTFWGSVRNQLRVEAGGPGLAWPGRQPAFPRTVSESTLRLCCPRASPQPESSNPRSSIRGVPSKHPQNAHPTLHSSLESRSRASWGLWTCGGHPSQQGAWDSPLAGTQ